MGKLNFNYKNAMKQADQIDMIARDMLTAAEAKMQNAIDSIDVCWKGEAAKQFLQHCIGLQDDVRDHVKMLHNISEKLRNVAERINVAEAEAKEIQRRSSDAGDVAKK